MKEHCIMCNKSINTDKDDYQTGESLGEYWCNSCAKEEYERMKKE